MQWRTWTAAPSSLAAAVCRRQCVQAGSQSGDWIAHACAASSSARAHASTQPARPPRALPMGRYGALGVSLRLWTGPAVLGLSGVARSGVRGSGHVIDRTPRNPLLCPTGIAMAQLRRQRAVLSVARRQ